MMKTLCETKRLIVEHSYEYVHLRDKTSNDILYSDEFYGDPECALIDDNEHWAVVGGDKLVVWSSNEVNEVKVQGLESIEAMREKGSECVEILVDPWSENAAVWVLNVKTLQAKKVRDFNNYKDHTYTNEIIW